MFSDLFGKKAGCGGCRAKSDKSWGVISYLKALVGAKASQDLQRHRMLICQVCPELEKTETGEILDVRLFRTINDKAYCGAPRLNKPLRNEAKEGCGCDLKEKVKSFDAECPRGNWGPGERFGRSTFKIEVEDEIPRIPDTIDIHLTSVDKFGTEDFTGLGDCISMLPFVHEMAQKYPNMKVRYIVKQHLMQWALWGWPHVENATLGGLNGVGVFEYRPNTTNFIEADLRGLSRDFPNRHATWADFFKFNGVWSPPAIPEDAMQWAKETLAASLEAESPVVLISPYAHSFQRSWPYRHFRNLCEWLIKAGVTPIIIDNDIARRHDDILTLYSPPPAATQALMSLSSLVIGNDSGMTHFAGLCGAPALAVCSPTIGRYVFGAYPSVKCVQSDKFCSGCYWSPNRGFKRYCNEGCEAMWDIKPEAVLTTAIDMIRNPVARPAKPFRPSTWPEEFSGVKPLA
jgi:ADP-heptose:LPS heptosyltransferase